MLDLLVIVIYFCQFGLQIFRQESSGDDKALVIAINFLYYELSYKIIKFDSGLKKYNVWFFNRSYSYNTFSERNS